jgi:hypothetical protein
MLVITGTGRSGTSVMARHCHNMGYLVGGRWSEKVNAGMEEPVAYELNNELKEGRIPDRAASIVKNFSRQVVKDPRFTCKHVLNYWASIRRDIRVLMLLRDTNKVIASRDSNPEWFKQKDTAEDLDRQIVDTYRTCGSLGIPVRTLEFPTFLGQYSMVHDSLTQFGELKIDKILGERSWNILVEPSKVHH